jgi:hypothetical protein
VRTHRRIIEWTIAVAILALLSFVPWLRDRWRVIWWTYLTGALVVALVRGKPEGVRFVTLSFLLALIAMALAVLAFVVNIWLGLAFIVIVPAAALIVTYRRDQRAALR